MNSSNSNSDPKSVRKAGLVSRIGPRAFGFLSALLALLILFLIIYPLGMTFARELFPGWTFNSEAFDHVASSSAFWLAARNTVIVLLVSGTLSLVIGTLFAWLNERTTAQMGFFSGVLPVLPLLVPSVAMAVGWIFLAQEQSGSLNVMLRALLGVFGINLETGPLNIASWPGLIFVYTLHLVPFVYLIVSVAFRALDPSLEEAARISGAGRLRSFLRVSVASVMPAIASAALLVAMIGIGLFSVPSIIGSAARIEILSVLTVRLIRGTFPARIAEGVVISLMLTIIVLGIWLIQRHISAKQRHATIGGKAGGTSLVELGPWKWVARVVVMTFVAMSTVLPFFALLLVALQPYWTPQIDLTTLSFSHFESVFSGGIMTRALSNSLMLGVVGATIGVIIAALLMEYARARKGWRGNAVLGITRLPAAITNIVLGVGFLVVLGTAPFNLQGTALILLLAYLIVYMPQAATAANSAIDMVGDELIEAGRMSGAGPGRVFGRVTFPLMFSGLASGWAMIFVVMVGDLTVSALLAGTRNPVVGFVILDIWENGTYSQLAALSAVITVICMVAVVFVLSISRSGRRKSRRGAARVAANPPA